MPMRISVFPISIYFEFAVAADQRIRRTIVAKLGLGFAVEFGDDAQGQHFAELHTPLVKRVDVPDRALGKNAVLIESDELAKRCGGSAAAGGSYWTDDCPRRCGGARTSQAIPRRGFPLESCRRSERLALGEDVCKQHVMLLAHRVQRLGEGDEVAGDQPGSLMDQLVKRMLAVGAGLTPKDWPGVAYDTVAVERYVLAVTIHRQLLEKAGKRFRILLVGEYADGLGAKEVGVPNRQQAHQHRKMALEGCGTKVLIDLVKTTEHRAEVFRTDSDHRRETDRRIHRVATDDPIPEREHVGGVDAERRHLGWIRRGGDKMSGDRSIAVVLEHFIDHHWSETGAANADIHDVADPLAGMAFPYAVADLVWRNRPSCRARRGPRARHSRHQPVSMRL